MKRVLSTLFATAVIVILIFAMTSCDMMSLLSGLGEGNFSGKPDSRFTGTWIAVTEDEESENFGYIIRFTEKGTIEYTFEGELKLNTGDGEQSGENVEIDLSELNEAFSAMQKLVTVTYEVKSDTIIETTMHSVLTKDVETSEVEYSFDGGTLVFDGVTFRKYK